MRVKWENWKGEKFEGEVVYKFCWLFYVKIEEDGSVRMIDREKVTVVSK